MKLKSEETAVWTTDDDAKIELTTSQTEAKLKLTRPLNGSDCQRFGVEVTVSVDDLLAMADRARDMLGRLGVTETELQVRYPINEGQVDTEELSRAIAKMKEDMTLRPIVFQGSQGRSPYTTDSQPDDEWEPENAPEGIDG